MTVWASEEASMGKYGGVAERVASRYTSEKFRPITQAELMQGIRKPMPPPTKVEDCWKKPSRSREKQELRQHYGSGRVAAGATSAESRCRSSPIPTFAWSRSNRRRARRSPKERSSTTSATPRE